MPSAPPCSISRPSDLRKMARRTSALSDSTTSRASYRFILLPFPEWTAYSSTNTSICWSALRASVSSDAPLGARSFSLRMLSWKTPMRFDSVWMPSRVNSLSENRSGSSQVMVDRADSTIASASVCARTQRLYDPKYVAAEGGQGPPAMAY